MTVKKIGWACKFTTDQVFVNKKTAGAWFESHNIRGTTIAALSRLSGAESVSKIVGILEHNVQALKTQFSALGEMNPSLRMIRMGSDVWPCYTHESVRPIYNDPAVKRVIQDFGALGDLAKKHGIRLSTHPGQYTMCVSNGEHVINRAIEDLEYHAEVFRVMGFDGSDSEQAINIHGGAKRPQFEMEFRHNFARLASDTQRWISVENDEFSYGLDDLLPLADLVKICVDINHYWIHENQYLSPSDPRLDVVVRSWRGARPKMHVAWPQETVLEGHDPQIAPDMPSLLAQGSKKSQLRAHSTLPWNLAVSRQALQFWPRFDLMTESKAKNITAAALLALSQENL